MRLFLDTSALLKLYLAEDGTEEVQKLCSRAKALIVSGLTKTEFYSSLGFNLRLGRITKAQYTQSISEGERDFADIEIVPFDAQIEKEIQRLSEKNGHRALDNIQLASAVKAKPNYFATGDKKLARLAKLENLKVKLV